MFRIVTCGAVHLWVDDARVAGFDPFRRNTPHSSEVSFDLQAGEQVLTLLLKDLHERDTTCIFRLTCLGGPDLEVALPEGLDTERVEEVSQVIAGLRMDKVFYDRGTARLVVDPPPLRAAGCRWTPRPIRISR